MQQEKCTTIQLNPESVYLFGNNIRKTSILQHMVMLLYSIAYSIPLQHPIDKENSCRPLLIHLRSYLVNKSKS